jgi:hypothetical protein
MSKEQVHKYFMIERNSFGNRLLKVVVRFNHSFSLLFARKFRFRFSRNIYLFY